MNFNLADRDQPYITSIMLAETQAVLGEAEFGLCLPHSMPQERGQQSGGKPQVSFSEMTNRMVEGDRRCYQEGSVALESMASYGVP